MRIFRPGTNGATFQIFARGAGNQGEEGRGVKEKLRMEEIFRTRLDAKHAVASCAGSRSTSIGRDDRAP